MEPGIVEPSKVYAARAARALRLAAMFAATGNEPWATACARAGIYNLAMMFQALAVEMEARQFSENGPLEG